MEALYQARHELFVMDGSNGYVPNGSTMWVSQGLFAMAGQLFAASICQGGPAPAFLATWVYKYLVYGTECTSCMLNQEGLVGQNFKSKELFKKVCFPCFFSQKSSYIDRYLYQSLATVFSFALL